MGFSSRGQAPLIWVELPADAATTFLNPWRPIASTITGHRIPDSAAPIFPLGWHRLWIQQDEGERFDNALVVAPLAPSGTPRGWGLPFSCTPCGHTPVLGFQGISKTSRDVGVWAADEMGADFVLVNPLHAAALVTPMENCRPCHRPGALTSSLHSSWRRREEYAYLSADDTARVTHIAGTARPQRDRGSDRPGRGVDRQESEAARADLRCDDPRPGRWPSPIFWLRREDPGLRTVACWEKYGPSWGSAVCEGGTRLSIRGGWSSHLVAGIFDEQLDTQRELWREFDQASSRTL